VEVSYANCEADIVEAAYAADTDATKEMMIAIAERKAREERKDG
jgi:hypothetical protein